MFRLSEGTLFFGGISIKTIEKHRQSVMNKLHIHEAAGLTRYAIAKGMVPCLRPSLLTLQVTTDMLNITTPSLRHEQSMQPSSR